MAQRVLTAKVTEELYDAVDERAACRGVTRNALVREALEATVDGRITPLDPHEALRRAFVADMHRGETALRAAFELRSGERNAVRPRSAKSSGTVPSRAER
jgi:hypothetical protein